MNGRIVGGSSLSTTNMNGEIIGGLRSFSANINDIQKRGYSAYDLAVQNGFKGSVLEFLESLKGTSVTIKSIEEVEHGVKITLSDGNEDTSFIINHGTAVMFVDELPDPNEADPLMIYILRQEV